MYQWLLIFSPQIQNPLPPLLLGQMLGCPRAPSIAHPSFCLSLALKISRSPPLFPHPYQPYLPLGICTLNPKIEPLGKAAQDCGSKSNENKRSAQHGGCGISRPLSHVVTGPFQGSTGCRPRSGWQRRAREARQTFLFPLDPLGSFQAWPP